MLSVNYISIKLEKKKFQTFILTTKLWYHLVMLNSPDSPLSTCSLCCRPLGRSGAFAVSLCLKRSYPSAAPGYIYSSLGLSLGLCLFRSLTEALSVP